MRALTLAAARQLRRTHSGGLRWAVRVVIGTTGIATIIVVLVLLVGLCHVYFDQTNLPDIEPFARFEFPAIGHIYDTNGQPLIELAELKKEISACRSAR
jgi:membrane carboxypeptidase/penicillin-binding protein